MIHFLYHYLYQDVYVPVWPNWVAGIVATVVVYFWKGKKWIRHHEEHRQRIKDIHEHLGLNK
jgi:hypothetical protein